MESASTTIESLHSVVHANEEHQLRVKTQETRTHYIFLVRYPQIATTVVDQIRVTLETSEAVHDMGSRCEIGCMNREFSDRFQVVVKPNEHPWDYVPDYMIDMAREAIKQRGLKIIDEFSSNTERQWE